MARPKLRFYAADDLAEDSTLSFAEEGGVTGTAQQLNLWNDKDGTEDSEDATELRISALSRDAGSGSFSYTDEAARDGWCEARSIGPIQTTPWTPIGRGKYLHLRPLEKDQKHELEFRLRVPAGAGTVHKEVAPRVHCARADVPLDLGHHESGARGVCTGAGDVRMSKIERGYLMTPNGSPDNKVDISTGVHVHQGTPKAIVGAEHTFSNQDVNAAALGSGEAYGVTVSVGSGSSATKTKGAKATAPLQDDDFPDVPAGEILVGYITVPFDATIEASDIDQTDREVGFFGYEATGLNVRLFGGWALTDNREILLNRSTTLTLQASATNYGWLSPDGSLTANTTGVAPAERALLLWKWTTDGSGITAAEDRRPWIGPRVWPVIMKKGGTLAATDRGYGVYPSPRPGTIRAVSGVVAAVRAAGSGSGATAFEVRKSEAGGSFTTLYTSSGTVDLRPSIPHSASNPVDVDSTPEVYSVGAFARFEFELTAVPGTPGTDAEVVVLVEES